MDPVERFQEWFAFAVEKGVYMPEAMALATADAAGNPSVRMVLLKDVSAAGFTFYTNLGSRKAQELIARPRASLCFHWAALERQVRLEGPVSRVSDAEADAYFRSRPRGSRIGAWASQQSAPLESRDVLVARVQELEARYPGEVPRPPFWSGFVVAPERIELWQGQPDRLHVRDVYVREGSGWRRELLNP
jgi:pyridoxamine 5'-phosphate oxidase